eukprot:TRINITY_DN126_c0_g1_i4.p1 TRINITY_DN126_c0_g1~~TRINITY_DN126_c0_g1_i4.p1  ORF type:complete len:318 (+),score=88.11 TRINITY_DN126_c0_g1_i4:163-1116(+)
MATIKPVRGFSAKRDIELFQSAVEGLNCEGHDAAVDNLIALAATRSWDQRAEIWSGYKKKFGEDPKEALKAKLGGSHFCHGLLALFQPAAERDAEWFRSAMKGFGTNEKLLYELIATRSSRQLKAIALAYDKLYEKELAGDIDGEVGGWAGKMLVKLITVPRSESVADDDRASELAQRLYDAGKGKWGTDEGTFVEILTTESKPTLKAVFSAYLSKFGEDIIEVIDDEFNGKEEDALKFLVKAVLSTSQVFADAIHDAVDGVGTDEGALVRFICGRADMDLEDIKVAFEEKYKKPLAERIAADEGGDLGKLLVAVLH